MYMPIFKYNGQINEPHAHENEMGEKKTSSSTNSPSGWKQMMQNGKNMCALDKNDIILCLKERKKASIQDQHKKIDQINWIWFK